MLDFLRKGNTYELEWQLTYADGTLINVDDVEVAQFILDDLSKEYPTDVAYDTDKQAFVINLTQEETYKFETHGISVQARVKFNDGSVDATDKEEVNIKDVLTRKIL